ncbi:MAG: glycosyltransferase family 2 protein [Calditrichia bacterium]|nr:glycosyltransferase family 2 protein [Calditrichia bacterium]
MTIGILILTYNAEEYLHSCLFPLINAGYKSNILIIDSSSKDQTQKIATELGVKIHIIPKKEFNHGATRELGRKLLGTDIVVMMTQDAFAIDDSLIEKLTNPIINKKCSIAYARQLPRKNANIFEALPREFNYTETSNIRSIDDIKKYGVYTFFCSNSCSAYLNGALDEIGGFDSVIIAEDYFAVAKLLKAGHKIAYVAEAQVEHSHFYSITQEFKRYFDTGYIKAENKWVNSIVGHAESRGMELLFELIKRLFKSNLFLIPWALFSFFIKWLGYRIGYLFYGLPPWINKILSSQPYYWDSVYFDKE